MREKRNIILDDYVIIFKKMRKIMVWWKITLLSSHARS